VVLADILYYREFYGYIMKRVQFSGSAKRKLAAAKQQAYETNRPKEITKFFVNRPIAGSASEADATHDRPNADGDYSAEMVVEDDINNEHSTVYSADTNTDIHHQNTNDADTGITVNNNETDASVLSAEEQMQIHLTVQIQLCGHVPMIQW
jgi:hypothetical protein